MGKIGKSFALILTLIVITPSLTIPIIKTANAQTITKPSVPEFTITVNDHSYYEPSTTPSYYTDPYTGEKHLIKEGQEGHSVQNGTIDLTIYTQKLDDYSVQGNSVSLYFRVAYKGHFEPSWNYFLPDYGFYGNDSQYLHASQDGINKVQFGFGQFSFDFGEYKSIYIPPSFGEIEEGGQIDFKVEAFVGHTSASKYATQRGLETYYAYIGESSGWSDVQTVSVPDGKVTIAGSTDPTPTATLPELSLLVILPLLLAVFSVIAVFRYRKTLT